MSTLWPIDCWGKVKRKSSKPSIRHAGGRGAHNEVCTTRHDEEQVRVSIPISIDAQRLRPTEFYPHLSLGGSVQHRDSLGSSTDKILNVMCHLRSETD